MKNLKHWILFGIIAFVNLSSVLAGGSFEGGNGQDVVGAPLDGGLLAILAGAGITYFAARKKKRNSQD